MSRNSVSIEIGSTFNSSVARNLEARKLHGSNVRLFHHCQCIGPFLRFFLKEVGKKLGNPRIERKRITNLVGNRSRHSTNGSQMFGAFGAFLQLHHFTHVIQQNHDTELGSTLILPPELRSSSQYGGTTRVLVHNLFVEDGVIMFKHLPNLNGVLRKEVINRKRFRFAF